MLIDVRAPPAVEGTILAIREADDGPSDKQRFSVVSASCSCLEFVHWFLLMVDLQGAVILPKLLLVTVVLPATQNKPEQKVKFSV